MKIQTSRFGEVLIALEDALEFAEGLLGFGHLRRFVLIDDPNDEIFAWLQSCERPEIAFPVLEPELFISNYKVDFSKADLEALSLKNSTEAKLLTIVTIPADPTLMTANLKAPLAINVSKRLARQCVLQDNALPIREPIFSKLQQRVVQYPNSSLKSPTKSIGAVKVERRAPELEA
jgi:flagellar assembly factor FliW